jgi:hypothetical protein
VQRLPWAGGGIGTLGGEIHGWEGCWAAVGLLGCWAVGLLGCWAVGLLGCWAVGRLLGPYL